MKKTILSSFFILSVFALSVFAQDTKALFQQGLNEFDSKQYEKAISTFKQVVAINPNDASAHFNIGLSNYILKNYQEAISAFQTCVRVKEDYAKAYIFLGNSFDELNRYDEAIAAYQKAVRYDPNNPIVYFELGTAHRKQKSYVAAAEAFRQAIIRKPNYYQAHYELGTAQNNLKQYPEAIESFNEAIRLNPNYPDAYLGLGNSYYNDNKFAESIPFYKKSAEQSPTFATAHHYLADAYLKNKQYNPAVNSYKTAIALDPKNSEAIYGLGLAYFNLNNIPLAQQQVNLLKTIDQPRANLLQKTIGTATVLTVKPTPNPKPTPKPTPKSAQRIKDEKDVANMPDFGFDGAVVTGIANIRETPKPAGKILLAVKRGDILSLSSREPDGNFYQVVEEKSGIEGWIDGKSVVIKLTGNTESSGPPLEVSGNSADINANPVVSISNLETKTTLNMRINGTLYKIPPQTTKTITVPGGKFTYYGWSPGIRPTSGSKTLEKGKSYKWSFKIYRR